MNIKQGDSELETMQIDRFPKIYSLGDRRINNIFDAEVEVTEKVDGSQFCFGFPNGELYCRSKTTRLSLDMPDRNFAPAVQYLQRLVKELPLVLELYKNCIFYGETLQKPRHNVLKYDRVPNNHIALFGGIHYDGCMMEYDQLIARAKNLGVEVVPLLYKGPVKSYEDIQHLLDRESFLGGCKIEGIVVKNYVTEYYNGGARIPVMSGKWVRDDFKEKMHSKMKSPLKLNKWVEYKAQFKTEARWQKAVQWLDDQSLLTHSPKDIGPLMKRVMEDIEEEDGELIKEWLYNYYIKEIRAEATKGLPQWWKDRLLKESLQETLNG